MEIYSLDYLHKYHLEHCISYKQIVQTIFPREKKASNIYIHAGLFKKINFKSGNIKSEYNYSSSGTSGEKSNIYFDRTDAINQQKYLISLTI